MLYSLKPGLQKHFERHGAYEMFQELKLIFQANGRVDRYEVSNKFFSYKMEENSYVNDHILIMSRLHNWLRHWQNSPITTTKLQELRDELKYARDE